MHIEPVSLRAMAERAVAGLTEDLKGRISLDISGDMWVLADAERLPMVISNLLTNAGEYAPGSPYRLAVRREQREHSSRRAGWPAGRKWMAKTPATTRPFAHRPRPRTLAGGACDRFWPRCRQRGAMDNCIFDRFVRTPQSLTTPVRGTGLGL